MPRKDRPPFFVRMRGFTEPANNDGYHASGNGRTASIYFAMEGQAVTISARVSDNGATEYRIDLVQHPAPGGHKEGISVNLIKAFCGPNADVSAAGTYNLPLPE